MEKIVIWGISTTATDENKKKISEICEKHKSLISFQNGKNKDYSKFENCLVVIKHDLINNEKEFNFEWKLTCTGNVTKTVLLDDKKIGFLTLTDLINNLEDFLKCIDIDNTTIDNNCINKLFAINSDQDKLLTPLINTHPTASIDLKIEKQKLIDYVNSQLKKG